MNYVFSEATSSQELSCWIGSHIRGFEFLGGVPALLVPDNLKSGITTPDLYEPLANETYREMAEHYSVAIFPARVKRPRDKAPAEHSVLGPTGVGKTFFARALGHQACLLGFSGLFLRTPRLFPEIALGRETGKASRLLAVWSKVDLLILDDLCLLALTQDQRHDLLEILEDRWETRSTLVTSQYPVDLWHERIGEPTLADAILDRLVHKAYTITLKGDSMRKRPKA